MSRELRVGCVSLALAAPACCVMAGTRVRTPRGERPIGELAVGDAVESIDIATGAVKVGEVAQLRRAVRDCLALRWRGGALICTPDHPLYSPERGDYRPAIEWISGGLVELLVRTDDGIAVAAVEASEEFAEVREVVDLSLAREPRNFVAAGIVVHNKSIAGPPTPSAEAEIPGPTVTLTADAPSRRFRLRACFAGRDLEEQSTFVRLRATSTASPPPPGDRVLWLSMYLDTGAGTARVIDGAAPGELELDLDSFDFPGTSCTTGLVIGLERLEEPADGGLVVDWSAQLSATLFGTQQDPDALSLAIDVE